MQRSLARWLLGSTRRQLTVGMGVLVGGIMLLFVLGIIRREQTHVLSQQALQAQSLAQGVARASSVWLASRDYAGLQEIIEGLQDYPELQHAVVLDLSGLVLAHSDVERRGQYLKGMPAEAKTTIIQNTEVMIDAASPVMAGGKSIGWVRIGLGGHGLAEQIAAVKRQGAWYALLAVILSSVFATITGRFLSQRLRAIQQVADAVHTGDTSLRVHLKGNDEAARLGYQFNAMLDRIESDRKALQNSEESFRLLVENSSEPMLVTSPPPESRVISINHQFAKVFGYTIDDVKDVEAWWPMAYPDPEYRLEMQAKWATAIDEMRQAGADHIKPVHATVQCRDGSARVVEVGMSISSHGALVVFNDVTEMEEHRNHLERLVNERTIDLARSHHQLQESEAAVRRKLAALLEPEGSMGDLSLSDIIDVVELQEMMNKFYGLTHIGCAIVDMKGKVLVANGVQDICRQYHRIQPETLRFCIESDTVLSRGVQPGTYKQYHCKNNMWHLATPIIIGGEHVGNMFLGQFFFEDDPPNVESFRHQAARYGFDEKGYLDALARVPVWSRKTVDATMQFYAKLADTISRLSYSTVKLSQAVSERDIHAQALVEARDVAESANRAKSVFLANMSHELRTPLNAIFGFSEMVGQDASLPEKAQDKVAIINRAGNHLLSMINDVLDLAKIEAGKLSLKSEPTDFLGLIEDLARMFDVRARAADLQFHLKVAPTTVRYLAIDGDKMRQVLINLLGNALKFTTVGGFELRVRTTFNATDPMPLCLHFEVKDSGPGIPVEKQQQIFRPFEQLGHPLSGMQKGTGLGLSICHSLVELMGGHMGVDSELGHGALFWVDVPVHAVEDPPSRVVQEDSSVVIGLEPGQPTYRVLVVEDDELSRELLLGFLQSVGFETREAVNGEKAIAQFQEWNPHFIWMDMRMPVMDGYEATRRIRALPGGDAVKIVAITASAFSEQHGDILDAGCEGIVHKPYRRRDVFDTMGALLGLRYTYQAVSDRPSVSRKITEAEVLGILEELHPGLRGELIEAAKLGDHEQFEVHLSKVALVNKDTANYLKAFLDDYRFDVILAHLEKKR